MATSHPRPDLAAHSQAAVMDQAQLISALREVLGAKLVAYIAGVNDTRIIRQLAEGSAEIDSEDTVEKLRIAYRAARLITDRDGGRVAQTWFQGMNPHLDDQAPAQVLRLGGPVADWQRVLAAAREFVA